MLGFQNSNRQRFHYELHLSSLWGEALPLGEGCPYPPGVAPRGYTAQGGSLSNIMLVTLAYFCPQNLNGIMLLPKAGSAKAPWVFWV